MHELKKKLTAVREVVAREGLGGVRLRGTDWFSWATCGGSNVVLLTTDTGIAEVFITADHAYVLTDEIEAPRLREEEVPAGLELWAGPWADPSVREQVVATRRGPGVIASDRPEGSEVPLPAGLIALRSTLLPEELVRYRALGRDAAQAMTEVLSAARPEWTGWQLAGAGAEALWSRGIHPALTLVGEERRLPLHRHATASRELLGERAMLVFCARRHGLFADLTRFVYFRAPAKTELNAIRDVAAVEAAAFSASRPGVKTRDVLAEMSERYRALGHPNAERWHHQGGPCGYGSRDSVARPSSDVTLRLGGAVAWNPSLPGAKIEDTVIIGERDVDILTVDPKWPVSTVEGRARPEPLLR